MYVSICRATTNTTLVSTRRNMPVYYVLRTYLYVAFYLLPASRENKVVRFPLSSALAPARLHPYLHPYKYTLSKMKVSDVYAFGTCGHM